LYRIAEDVGCCTGGIAAELELSMNRQIVTIVRGDISAELADAFARSALVAWDVETSGLDWQRDRLGTCQLFAEDIGAAVVTVGGCAVPKRLAALLADPSVVKVFHHAPFDLRFMAHAWRVRPASIRCTKVASKLLNPNEPNESHSLQRLVLRRLGVQLQKGEVRRSDWSAIHLTGEQIEYAVGDVIHLPALLRSLQDALDMDDKGGLYDDCCAFLPARVVLELGRYPDVFAY
jgi:ribonuclease D